MYKNYFDIYNGAADIMYALQLRDFDATFFEDHFFDCNLRKF